MLTRTLDEILKDFGAGMGLANSKRVADNFTIQSKVPTGTTVMCEFNLNKK